MAKIDLIEKMQFHFQEHKRNLFLQRTETSLNYGDLDLQSSALAVFLKKEVTRGSAVALYGHKEPALFVSLFACIKAGVPYLPIDVSVPLERVKNILQKAECRILLNVTNTELGLDSPPVREISISQLEKIFQNPPETFDWSTCTQPQEVLYILFTSGSTGEPKGVQVTRANVEDFLSWTVSAFDYANAPLGFLNHAPLNFDLSVYELFNALVTGGSLLSICRECATNLVLLFNALSKFSSSLNVWVSTPSGLALAASSDDFSAALLPNLREFVLIGEVFPPSLAREIKNRFPKARILNFYGPTEATVAHTVMEITEDCLGKYSTLPIGKTKPNSRVLLEDGEIVLTGPNIANGYIHAQEKTAECFVMRDGEPAYRTGDLGHFDENGLLFFTGRRDHQLKLNGYRIELGDIEAQLAKVEGIEYCCVLPILKNDKVEYLCAFVVAFANSRELSDLEFRKQIRESLAQHLPSYMLPKRFIRLQTLPLNANGKIDRAALQRLL